MITEERVAGVIVLATTDEQREFAPDELSVLQAVASEAALAFERLRSAAALAEALEREKRAAEIVRRLRAELDPDAVVRVARDELTEALALDSIAIDASGDHAQVDVERESPLTEGELALVEIVRYEIGAAVRIAALLAESSRQARVQRGFYRIASLLGEPVSPAEAYDAAAQAAADALGGDFAAVLARGAGGLVFVGGHDLRPEVRDLPVPEAFADAAHDGQVLAAPMLAHDDRFPGAWHQASFSSLLAIPVRGEQAELVLVFYDEAHAFSKDDLELAQQVARAARGAFERSRLFDAERTARSLAQQLARTGTLLATELDPAAVLDAVVAQAVELLRVDAAALTSLDDRDLVVDGRGRRRLGRSDRCSFTARCERTGRRHAVAFACDVRRRVAERQPPRRRCVPRRRQRCVPRRAAERSRRLPLRRAVRIRPCAAGVARGRSPGTRWRSRRTRPRR